LSDPQSPFGDIVVRLDVLLALQKRRAKDLAQDVGITEANISQLKSGKVKGIRFETLAKLCFALDCKPDDILEYRPPASASDKRQ